MNNFILKCTRCGKEVAVHNDKKDNQYTEQSNIKISTYEWVAEIQCKCGNMAIIQQ